MRKILYICGTVFCIIAECFVFFKIQDRLFKVNVNIFSTYQVMKGFYAEPKNSLDAVFIGASNVHNSWQPPLAWENHGIKVYSFSVDSMPVKAIPWMIREAKKRQPDALIIINTNRLYRTDVPETEVHRVTNYIPFSMNKLRMIHYLAAEAGFSGLDQLQFYFPIIKFHSGWSQLSHEDFTKENDGLKRGFAHPRALTDIQNNANQYRTASDVKELTGEQKSILNDIFSCLSENNWDALFVSLPRIYSTITDFPAQLNRIGEIIQERGYGYLDLFNVCDNKACDELGLQLDTDFLDNAHLNIHGTIKFTEYFADYLVEQYGFADKRGQPETESWDRASKLFTEIIAPYTLPFERLHAPRDYSLSAPDLLKAEVTGTTITLTWNPVSGADSYDIYFKYSAETGKNWQYLASVGPDEFQYTESMLETNTRYTFTVVPKAIKDNIEYFGNFSYEGIAGRIE